MTQLFHYTCQHGRDGLGDRSALVPPSALKVGHASRRLHGIYAELDCLIWMTDLDYPVPHALGLTRALLDCDRTQHRYAVVDLSNPLPYLAIRRSLHPTLTQLLETKDGAMPRHWWVSSVPVPVQYLPIGGSA